MGGFPAARRPPTPPRAKPPLPSPLKLGMLFRAAGPPPQVLERKARGGGRILREGPDTRRRGREGELGGGPEGGGKALCGEAPSLERPVSFGTFLGEPLGKVHVNWRVNSFLSEEVIPFYVNTSLKQLACDGNAPLRDR